MLCRDDVVNDMGNVLNDVVWGKTMSHDIVDDMVNVVNDVVRGRTMSFRTYQKALCNFDQNWTIYTVFHKESESEAKKHRFFHPGGKNQEIRNL